MIFNINKIHSLFLLIILFPLSINGQELDISYTEHLIISGEYSEENPFVLGEPKDIRTDKEENIFISDLSSLSIRIFDKNGVFVKNIGRRGRGPGEFLHINTFNITDDESLLVLDAWGGYRATKFLVPSANIADEYPIDPQKILWPIQIHQLSSESYLLLFLHPSSLQRDQSASIFHIFSKNFKKEKQSFGSFSDIKFDDYYDPLGNEKLSSFIGSMELVNKEEILFVPQIYNGEIYKYNLNTGNDSVTSIIKGKKFREHPFVTYDNKPDNVPYTRIASGGKQYWGSVLVINAGIFVLNNGNIVNFTLVYNKDTGSEGYWDLYAELFNEDYDFLGYDLVKRIEESIYGEIIHNTMVNWKDEDDYFYLNYKNEKDIPVIRKVEISFTNKN